ncbi:MAG TPA: isoprenylcysteine carboxylmethyltransferase family protein [Bacteroidota bacterium]|nr:isoprenylcysteine carboxylmethyltransferase family protein [Bacteroidota bacterium]
MNVNHNPLNAMARTTVLPPTLFMTAAFASVALHFALPVVTLIRFPVTLVGLVPIVCGAILNLWADQLFKKRATTVKPFETPSAFITEDPFAWSRHPMYLGMVLLLVGISLLCGSLASFIPPLLFWLIMRLRFIPAEEHSMTQTFGEEYIQYTRRVRSWI